MACSRLFLVCIQALSAFAAIASGAATSLRGIFGSGTVLIPLPFSKASVNNEAHSRHSQKYSIRREISRSQRFNMLDDVASVSSKNSFPSLNLRNEVAHCGLAHFCSIGTRTALV
jgi:hypothetical protein